jgi:hypothetical protein
MWLMARLYHETDGLRSVFRSPSRPLPDTPAGGLKAIAEKAQLERLLASAAARQADNSVNDIDSAQCHLLDMHGI